MPRTFTPEQRAESSARAKAQAAARKARLAAGVETPDPPVVEPPTQDAAADELKQLAAALYSAAGDKIKRTRAVSDLEAFLERLNPRDFPEIANSDVVLGFVDQLAKQKAETNLTDPPGTVYGRGTVAQHKKPWTERDLANSGMSMVEFYVAEPECVIWNGLRRDYQPGETYRDYKCFLDVITERNRNLRLANEHAEYLFKKRTHLTDPSVTTLGTARVRGTAEFGSYGRAAGLFSPEYKGAGEPDTEEE